MNVEYILNYANGKNIAVCNTLARAKSKAGIGGVGVEWRQSGTRWWGFVNGKARYCIHTHEQRKIEC